MSSFKKDDIPYKSRRIRYFYIQRLIQGARQIFEELSSPIVLNGVATKKLNPEEQIRAFIFFMLWD